MNNNNNEPVKKERPDIVNLIPPRMPEENQQQNNCQTPPGAIPPASLPVPHVDCKNISGDPNTIEYWKQVAYLNGESCKDVTDALAKSLAELHNVKKAKEKLEEELDQERNRKAIVVPNNLLDLLTHCTTGKVQSITIYFATDQTGQDQ